MNFKVFISHSVAPRELGVVYAMANEAAKRGASPFVPDREWEPKGVIPERIRSHLKETDYLLAIATSSGFQLDWLNREVREGLREAKPILVVVDKGIRVPSNTNRIWINRTNPVKTIQMVSTHLAEFGRDKKTKEFLTWIGIGGLFFLLLLEKEK
ncbi:MAG: toll/interleukin-1 receptor domain-containing protein [bacterium]